MEAGALNNLLISLQGSSPVREGREEEGRKGRGRKEACLFGLNYPDLGQTLHKQKWWEGYCAPTWLPSTHKHMCTDNPGENP